jgi:hypothetical protein
MTKRVRDEDTHPFGHSIAPGRSALHPGRRKTKHHHRTHPAAHDLDVLTAEAERGVPYTLKPHPTKRGHGKAHKHRGK